jgi:hypothetical protein
MDDDVRAMRPDLLFLPAGADLTTESTTSTGTEA